MSHSIGEISKHTGLSSRTLRVWEDAGLVQASRDENGIRLYSNDIFSRIDRIQILKGFGLSLSDISSIFSGLKAEYLRDLLVQRREEIEQEALRLSRARQKLRQVEDLLGDYSSPQSYSDFLVTPERAKKNALDRLLVESGLNASVAHREYLNAEFAGLSAEEVVAHIALFKRIVRCAELHGIPLNFVRGHGSSRLALHLCDWKTVDPFSGHYQQIRSESLA